jgi:hypothetical protein
MTKPRTSGAFFTFLGAVLYVTCVSVLYVDAPRGSLTITSDHDRENVDARYLEVTDQAEGRQSD